ncbi:FAD-binding domain-containing protein [Roseibium sp. HPY-6]|uniref:FAD-binding domain-containing protein n=1 Tax=Roseibium sp. HPY-6 TaxID=3229852 RepID=UPI00338DACC4
MITWKPTRSEALQVLEDFIPKMGRAYASGRNYDHGPGAHQSVSCLSPYIRRRLITEQEVVNAALEHHGQSGAEKFIQEVLWRSYFKGWLERRPGVWSAYRQGLAQDLDAVSANAGRQRALEEAESGRTGLDCFDAWARELTDTGYLHNHARMWFASIWIFTLKLPWRVGADFFLRHLLDGDPASNTLSWRWVAGLHTRGKLYEAQAWNIEKFTGGRFTPEPFDFETAPIALDGTEPEGLPPLQPVRPARPPERNTPTLVVLTEDDCLPETLFPDHLDIRSVAILPTSELRSPRPVAGAVARFETGALLDAGERFGNGHEMLDAALPESLVVLAERCGARQLLAPFAPTGPLKDFFDAAAPAIAKQGLCLSECRRPWDDAVWRYASAGFFKVKKQIPNILDTMAAA